MQSTELLMNGLIKIDVVYDGLDKLGDVKIIHAS